MALKEVKTVDTRINKKRNNFIRVLMILSLLSLVGYYAINKYYLRPKRYKERMMREFNNYPSFSQYSEEQKVKCLDCYYNGLKEKYGDVSDFPGENKNAVIDLEYYKIIISCNANSFYSNSDRDFALNKIDSLAKVMFINDMKKGKI